MTSPGYPSGGPSCRERTVPRPEFGRGSWKAAGPGFHSSELYFWTEVTGGKLGQDLRMSEGEESIFLELKYVSRDEQPLVLVLPEGLWERLWHDIDAETDAPIHLGVELRNYQV